MSSFTTPSVYSAGEGQSPAISHFTYTIRDKKILLNWTSDKNEDTDQFEIERSTDGKNFVMAALVFGTDRPGADNYYFFEKASSKKRFYRIKIIQKDKSIAYSVILPATKEPKQSTNL